MEEFFNNSIIGISLKDNTLSFGKIKNGKLGKISKQKIDEKKPEEGILTEIIDVISNIFDDHVKGIGISISSMVNTNKGIIHKMQRTSVWREVHLKEILESRFGVEVYINNEANCLVAGEKYFGLAKNYENAVSLIIDSSVTSGTIFNGHLFSGTNSRAGEFGLLPYRDYDFEHYCSEGYFDEKYGIKYNQLYKRALVKDKIALSIFEQYGYNLGNLIKIILFTIDPQIIIIGGSISKSYNFFEKAMWEKVKTFPYKESIKNLIIEPSKDPKNIILGAVSLYFDGQNVTMKKVEA